MVPMSELADGRSVRFPELTSRVDNELNSIKGGGACQLREKVLAEAATTWIIVADYRKNSHILGTTVRPLAPGYAPGEALMAVEARHPHRGRSLCLRQGLAQPRRARLALGSARRQARTLAANGQDEGRTGRQRQRQFYHRRAVPRAPDEEPSGCE